MIITLLNGLKIDVRRGNFAAHQGFLIIQLIGARLDTPQLVAKPDSEKCARVHMPILATGWAGSDLIPHFQSLN